MNQILNPDEYLHIVSISPINSMTTSWNIRNWLKQYDDDDGKDSIYRWSTKYLNVIHFKHEEDALMFKLTFGF